MKGFKRGFLIIVAMLALVASGCIYHDDDDDDDCNDCGGGSDPGWFMLTTDIDLVVGEECPITCLPDLCTGFLDTDYYPDSIYLSDYDYGLDDIHLNYAVENLGYDTTDVYITLCDLYGCEEVAYIPALLPGEYYETSIDSAVLDSAMIEFWDCLDYYGKYCSMYYDIDVYIDQDGTCSMTALNYFFEGYYLW